MINIDWKCSPRGTTHVYHNKLFFWEKHTDKFIYTWIMDGHYWEKHTPVKGAVMADRIKRPQ